MDDYLYMQTVPDVRFSSLLVYFTQVPVLAQFDEVVLQCSDDGGATWADRHVATFYRDYHNDGAAHRLVTSQPEDRSLRVVAEMVVRVNAGVVAVAARTVRVQSSRKPCKFTRVICRAADGTVAATGAAYEVRSKLVRGREPAHADHANARQCALMATLGAEAGTFVLKATQPTARAAQIHVAAVEGLLALTRTPPPQ